MFSIKNKFLISKIASEEYEFIASELKWDKNRSNTDYIFLLLKNTAYMPITNQKNILFTFGANNFVSDL